MALGRDKHLENIRKALWQRIATREDTVGVLKEFGDPENPTKGVSLEDLGAVGITKVNAEPKKPYFYISGRDNLEKLVRAGARFQGSSEYLDNGMSR